MAKGKAGKPADDGDDKSERQCVHKGCSRRVGLKKSKSGNWYCATHHPDLKAKVHAKLVEGGKKRGKQQQQEKILLTLNIEGNKGSVLKALVQQVNFLAKDVSPKEMKRHRMIVDINKLIYEFATEGVGEAEKSERIKELLESNLPATVKLGKLVDLVGPNQAMELVKVELQRDEYAEETLDGVKLLQAKTDDGKPAVSTPHSLSIEEKEDTADDVPDLDVGIPDGPDSLPGQGKADAAPQAPPGGGTQPPAQAAPAEESLEERKARAVHSANELVGLYKTKIIGSIRTLDEVGKIFYDAILDGVNFRDLQQRVMFPKSDTDQPEMMVRDVREAASKRRTA
jgi:hypothetical protein